MVVITASVFPIAAYAGTDGSGLQITDQPDRLILQLGPQWAGTEFELKTDAGIFPIPVVADQEGILRMDLGGSKTYTLSCLAPITVAPEPLAVPETPAASPSPGPSPEDAPVEATEQEPGRGGGINALHLTAFLTGIAIAVGGLVAMRYFKRRHGAYYYDDSEDDYD